MNEFDMRFIDEYKHLEQLCNDIFATQSGISEYIEEMERKGLDYRCENDYKQLKHARWLRNQLVHEPYQESCTNDDIFFVENFYQRIMQSEDPLSGKRPQSPKQATRGFSVSDSAYIRNSDNREKKDDIYDSYEEMMSKKYQSDEPKTQNFPPQTNSSPQTYRAQQPYQPPQTYQSTQSNVRPNSQYQNEQKKNEAYNETQNNRAAAIIIFAVAAIIIAVLIFAAKNLG